jgi:hypothetical protein
MLFQCSISIAALRIEEHFLNVEKTFKMPQNWRLKESARCSAINFVMC